MTDPRSDGKRSGGQPRKDVVRNLERVLRAAHELFAERGSHVTMEEVARRAGVGVGTVYRRFPSKEHLFVAVSQAACSHTHRCIRDAAEARPDPIDKLKALVQVHFQHIERQAALLAFHADPSEQRRYEVGAEQFYTTLHDLLQQIIVEGQCAGVLAQGDPRVLAAMCMELLHPRAYHNLHRFLLGSTDDVARHVIDFLLRGLAPR